MQRGRVGSAPCTLHLNGVFEENQSWLHLPGENTLSSVRAWARPESSHLQDTFRSMVYYGKNAVVDEYFDLSDHLYSRHNDQDSRILFGQSWARGSTDEFHQRVKASAHELGKVQIHIHTLQTPVRKPMA